MKNKISNSDRHNLQVVAFIAIFTAVCVAIFVGTRYIPLKWIGIILVAAEVLFLMPRICSMYYEMHEIPTGIMCYVPLLNVIQVFPPIVAKVATVACFMDAFLFACMFIPMHVIAGITGEQIALMFTGRCFIFFFVGLVICSIIIGIGYCCVLQAISDRLYELYNLKLGGTTWLWRVFLFIPIVRACGLTFIYTQLNSLSMQNYGNSREYTDEFYEEEM